MAEEGSGEGTGGTQGYGWRQRGRNVGMTYGGYQGTDADAEGTEAGGGEPDFDPVADLGITEGVTIDEIKKAEATDPGAWLGDDSPDWSGHDDPPIILPTIPEESTPEFWDKQTTIIYGCMDPEAKNYDPNATVDIGYCEYEPGAGPPDPGPPPEEGDPVVPTGTPRPPHDSQPYPPIPRPPREKPPISELTREVVTGASSLETTFTFAVNLTVTTGVAVPVYSVLFEAIRQLMKPNFDNYYDQMRVGKTLLNFGDNEQLQIINWKQAEGNKVALRLQNTLPTQYEIDRRVMVSREIQSSVFDVIKFLPVDAGPLVPQLRPAVSLTTVGTRNKVTGTLTDLISGIAGGSGSFGISSSYSSFVGDGVLENYYNVSNQSIDINADYSNFENFVTFGSAQKRIDVFVAKIDKIQELVKKAPVFVEDLNLQTSQVPKTTHDTVFGTLTVETGSVSLSHSKITSPIFGILSSDNVEVTGSVDYINTAKQVSKQIQELIRSMDGYENELYFESTLPYSASDDTNHDIDNQYKADYTYPTTLGIPLASTAASAQSWYSDMSAIATSYDGNNKNRLTENIPNYLWEDEDSVDFVTFVDLIGHHFDNIKIYIKNLENLSSRYPKIDKEISGQMAAHVLESFGVSIPSITSVDSLVKYVTGDNTGSVSYKKIADEYYNRYVHALPFLLKTKGTKQSINSLLNVFGINPNLLTIQESVTGKHTTIEPVKVTTSEQDFSLEFNSGSWLRVPFTDGTRSPKTIQSRLSFLDARSQTVFNFEPSASYQLNATLHPSASDNTYYTNYGRLELVSGSGAAATASIVSSYFDLFDENPVSIQLKYDTAGAKLDIRKIENELTSFTQSIQESAVSMSGDWDGLQQLYIGVPATASIEGYQFSGSLDEFRLWGEQVNDGKFVEFAENPGMFAGNNYSSSLQELFVRLSFNLPTDVYTSQYVVNTSPYVSKSQAGLTNVTNISSSATDASGTRFSQGTSPLYNTKRGIRTVIENSFKVGANTPTTDMIRIAPAPPSSGALSSTSTLISVDKKFQTSSLGTNEIDMSISPIDAVDRDVIRSFGNINLGQYIGRPVDRTADNYPLLENIEEVFLEQLAPTIDYNAFIRFFDKFLHLFGEAVKDYMPARARITEGIVIRSPILHRNKMKGGTRTVTIGGEVARRRRDEITDVKINRNDTASLYTFDYDAVRSYDAVLSVSSSLGPSVAHSAGQWPSDVQGDFTSRRLVETVVNNTASLDYVFDHKPIHSHIRLNKPLETSLVHGYNQIRDWVSGSYVVPDLDRVGGFDSTYATVVRKKEQGIKNVIEPQFTGFTEYAHDIYAPSGNRFLAARDGTTVFYAAASSSIVEGMDISGSGIPKHAFVAHVTDYATLVASGIHRKGSGSFTMGRRFGGGLASATATYSNVTCAADESPGAAINPFSLQFTGDIAGNVDTPSLIEPIDDFVVGNGFRADNTYFNNPYGFTYIDEVKYIAITQSYMNTAPNVYEGPGGHQTASWSPDTTYVLGDVVLQPAGTTGSTGNQLSENEKFFVFIDRGFPKQPRAISKDAPQLDAAKWTALRYKTQGYQRLARLAHVGGDTENVSLLKHIIIPSLTVTGNGVSSFTDATCDYDDDPTITHDANTQIVNGLIVSGTGIPEGSTVTGASSGTFELSATTTGGAVVNGTLTFTKPSAVTIDSVTTSGIFELSAAAVSTNASSSLTFTNASGSAFTHICSTTVTDATVTHFARYDSIPTQYTKKHFRFFRENSIGARRRTYVGTQNTETTSVDFGLPFETYDVNVNTITVGTTTPSAAQPPGGTPIDERI